MIGVLIAIPVGIQGNDVECNVIRPGCVNREEIVTGSPKVFRTGFGQTKRELFVNSFLLRKSHGQIMVIPSEEMCPGNAAFFDGFQNIRQGLLQIRRAVAQTLITTQHDKIRLGVFDQGFDSVFDSGVILFSTVKIRNHQNPEFAVGIEFERFTHRIKHG